MNKRGATWPVWAAIAIVGSLFLIYLLGGWGVGDLVKKLEVPSLGEAGKDVKKFSDPEVFNNERLEFFNYIFGGIPQYLVDLTSPVSAAIIIFGIWLLFFLAFGDVIPLFGSFNKPVGWVAAAVLTIIAANLRVVTWIAVSSLVITSALGTFSVAASILLIFILFLGFTFGSDKIKELVERKKMSEMRMRAAMGSEKAKAGLKALKDIGVEVTK